MNQPSYHLDRILYRFNQIDPFTIRNACEGVQVFGGIGSGKTSGSGAHLARAYLKAGFGGLILCAKKDEAETWLRYAKETGRSESVMVFDASGDYRFPFLQYEVKRKGAGAGYTENLVRLFTTVFEAIDRSSGGGGSDPYWSRAMQQLIRNAIDLVMTAKGSVSVPEMAKVIATAPRSPEERDNPEWRESSLCWQLLKQGNEKELDEWSQYDFDSTVIYWMEEFANLAPRTRSGIVSMFTSMADNFLRKPFRMLFCEEPKERKQWALPELTHRGAIIIMNLPVKEFGEAGRAAQVVYKYAWQQAAERRDVANNPRPVFLWVDEAQNFATEYDMQFQATARSSRACTVYLTQNMPNYYAEMGGESSRQRVNSLVGNLQTKIWHANSDPETNNQASDIIGKSWQIRRSEGMSYGGEQVGMSENIQESFDYDVPPQRFTRLRKGGTDNDLEVDAIVFQNGRAWSNGDTHFLATFKQQ